MYSTCTFCNRSLGSNEVIEEFPVGRRLAFDAGKGRLWVVCRSCERWNLSPIEERWEAVEQCERLFRGTRLRVSTANVGLARHGEGLELVRIGAPLRHEFAAWRYGDQFGRRRRRAMLYGVGGFTLIAGASLVGPIAAGGSGLGGYWIWQLFDSIDASRTRMKLHAEDGRVVKLRRDDLPTARLAPAEDGPGYRLGVLKGRKEQWFEGAEAERFASRIVPQLNRSGGKRKTVEAAVRKIEELGHPERFIDDLVRGERFERRSAKPGYIKKMPTPIRLALEMALHEEDERRALEGELWRLERAWEEAEEIAAISDDLLVPTDTRTLLSWLKGDRTASGSDGP